MKKIMLIFVFLSFNVGAMKNKDIAQKIVSQINFRTGKEIDETLATAAQDTLEIFIGQYPNEKTRSTDFISLVDLISKKDIENIEKNIEKTDKTEWVITNIKSLNSVIICFEKFLEDRTFFSFRKMPLPLDMLSEIVQWLGEDDMANNKFLPDQVRSQQAALLVFPFQLQLLS